MRLEYRLTEKDYVHFNEDYIAKSATLKQSKKFHYVAVPVSMLLLTLLSASHGASCLIYLVTGLVWLVAAPTLWKRSIRRRLERLLREGDNSTRYGPQTLTITPEGVAQTTDIVNIEMKWQGISRVTAGEHAVYLYTSGSSAYIVPNTAFNTVNTRERFMEEALRYRELAAGIVEVL